MREKKIIFTTYACHPKMGSEPGHGWGLLLVATKIAEKNNLICVCLTIPRYIKPISEELRRLNLLHCIELVAVPIPKTFDVPKNGFLLRIGFIIFSYRARRVITKFDEEDIKVIHHSNYASEVLPNPIPRKKFRNSLRVIGPIGSSQNLRVSRILIRDFRDLFIFLMDSAKFFLSRFLFRMFVDSNTKVVFNSKLIQRKVLGKKKLEQMRKTELQSVFPSICLEDSIASNLRESENSTGYKVAIVSVLNRRKKIDFALEVLSSLNIQNLHCDIYGDGPERENLQKMSVKLNIESKISWKGTIDREELRDLLASYDAILHPSVREGASTITGEAIVAGVPIVVFDGTGAAGTLEHVGLFKTIVSTRLVRSRSELVKAFSSVLLSVLGMKLQNRNPFSPELFGSEMTKWYELGE
jgi:glycosyltransferase involved in cell wall biosynthesis